MFLNRISGFHARLFPKSAPICALNNNNNNNHYYYSTKPSPSVQEETIQEWQTEIGRFSINYTQAGSGDHVILGLPGIFGTIETDFKPIISRLNKKKFTIVTWDAPGYGKSKLTSGTGFRKLTHNNYEEDSQTAAQLMKNLGFDQYSILGWSRGTPAGVHLIHAHPEKIRKLCIWGSPAYIDEQGVMMATTLCNLGLWPRANIEPLIRQYGEQQLQDMLIDVKNYVTQAHRTGSYQMAPLLAKMPQIPTLIIHGENDMSTHIAHAKVYHENIPNSKLEIWKNATHFLHLEQTDKLVKRIERFLLSGI